MFYTDGMEGTERRKGIDLLNENLKVTFEIAPDALANLPIVSIEDKQTGRERYRGLLGTVERRGRGAAHLEIRGVYEAEQVDLDLYGFYREGVEEVTYDAVAVREETHRIVAANKEFAGWRFVGDIHTHPTSGLAYPSEADLRSMVAAYESGDFKPNEQYIFGIAAQRDDGEMEYNFYRMVRTRSDSGYGFKRLEHP